MLKRKVFDELFAWKEKREKLKLKKCLIVQGARQVGKTYAIEKFGEEAFDEIVSVNFKETPDAAEIFKGDLNVDNLILSLRFRFPDKKILPGRTLIFFDEIQECEEAITALKFWALDMRYDVIASGSMLGIDYKRASSYPVGYVDYIQMYGLDLEEFLWALGIGDDLIKQLKEMFVSKTKIPDAIHSNMMKNLRLYTALGGMPEVVFRFVTSNDIREADEVQRELLRGYLYDIAHYANAEEKVKAEKCFMSLTKQLLDKENHKFQYKEVEKGGRAQKYYSSIDWLLRADIIRLCKCVSDIRYDLNDYADDTLFRAYTSDISLLIAMKDFYLKQHIIENTLSGTTKGGIYECVIADIFIKKNTDIFYYKNAAKKREIDFLIQKEGAAIPIEVKSGHKRSSSLNLFMESNKATEKAYKFIDGNTGEDERGIITMPLYMAAFI